MDKMKKVMGEFKEGKLYSGKGKKNKVKDKKQAIAIGLSEEDSQTKKAIDKGINKGLKNFRR